MKKKLRPAKPKELKPGGVWYYRDDQDNYTTVINDNGNLNVDVIDGFKEFIKIASKEGRLYINRSRPNYCLDEKLHKLDYLRMQNHEIKS